MRVINQIFLAAAAAALALVSCTKETTDNTENTQGQKSGVRTITVSFAGPEVRTIPTSVGNDIQPVWAGGETLTLKCGDQTKNVVVPSSAANNTSFEFNTELQGTIEVYYPGWTSDNDKYWDASGNVKIPASQSGEFATANLCKGTVAEDGTNLTLINQTALFQVTPPSGVMQFTITSLKTIVNGHRTDGTAANIADNATVITVGDNSAELGICYVALAEGVNLSDLSFEYTTDATHGAMKGIPMKNIAEGKDAVTAGSVYTITNEKWHEYVKVDGKKWATMNVGATSSTDYGYYFAWGETDGHIGDTSTKKFENDYSFSWTNAPFNGREPSYSETEFNKVKDTVCPNGVLALAYDAAFWNWGGAWRMPTKGEFNIFISGASYTGGNFEYNGVTFPAAGVGIATKLQGAGSAGGYYWSSSLYSSLQDAYHLSFVSNVGVGNRNRYYGESVRPLSE